MEKALFQVPGIHCMHCVHTIEMEIGEIPGVRRIEADQQEKTVLVEYESPATQEKIVDVLRSINYPPDL